MEIKNQVEAQLQPLRLRRGLKYSIQGTSEIRSFSVPYTAISRDRKTLEEPMGKKSRPDLDRTRCHIHCRQLVSEAVFLKNPAS